MHPVLLLHGALGSKSQLEWLKDLLTKQNREVFIMNFSGHSGEAFQDGFGIEQFAEDVHRFLKKENLSCVDVFAYSMGGYVALWLAYQQPQLINRIITLGTKFDWSVDSAQREVKKLNPEKIEEKVPAFARLLETRHAPNNWKDVLAKTSAMMLGLGEKPLLTDEVLATIHHPALILLGDLDDMADKDYSEKVSKILLQARFELLKDTPHPIEKVDKQNLTEIVIKFFN